MAEQRVPIELPDSLQSRATIRILDLVSEGEIVGLVDGLRSVYLNDTPLQNDDGSFNFQGVRIDTRPGTLGQSHMPGFGETETETAVGVEVTAATPIVRTVSDGNVNAVRVKVRLPALQQTVRENGDIVGATVQYAFDLQASGGSYVPQVLGEAYQPMVGATTPSGATAVSGRVQWTHTLSGTTDDTGQTAYNPITVAWELQIRVAPAGAWSPWGSRTESGAADGGDQYFDAYFELPTTVPYEVRVVQLSGDGTVALVNLQALVPSDVITVSGKASSPYERSHRIVLTGSAPWDIRMRRITADATTQLIADKTFWSSYTEVIETKLLHRRSALVGVTFLAEQFRTAPQRGYRMRLLKIQIPSNYDPIARSYSGVWDGLFQTAWSNNPAWVFYDLVTNARYGLGAFIDAALVDKWSLYTIAQYCDGLVSDGAGKWEPRFTCNVWMATRTEAFRLLQDLASCFRGMLYWAGGALTVTLDAPSEPIYTYTAANVIDGKFVRQGSDLRQRHTVALVTWNDPQDLFRQKVEYVEDEEGIARYGVQETQIAAFGCTSRGQARRAGKWLLTTERQETETITFRVGMDGAARRPGQVVEIHDPTRAGVRWGGRITAATGASVTLDATVTIGAGTHTLSVLLPDGTIEQRTVTNPPGADTILDVSPGWSTTPLAGAVWVLRSNALVPEQARIVAVQEERAEQSLTWGITAVRHDPNKFTFIETGNRLQSAPTSLLQGAPSAVANLAVAEWVRFENAVPYANLRVSWDAMVAGMTYRAVWRQDAGNWTTEDLSYNELALEGVAVGSLYTIRVRAISQLGVEGPATQIVARPTGQPSGPADPELFSVNVSAGDVPTFTFSAPGYDPNLAGFMIRRQEYSDPEVDWDRAVPINASPVSSPYVASGANWWGIFLIRSISVAGALSPNMRALNVTPASVARPFVHGFSPLVKNELPDPHCKGGILASGALAGHLVYALAGTPTLVGWQQTPAELRRAGALGGYTLTHGARDGGTLQLLIGQVRSGQFQGEIIGGPGFDARNEYFTPVTGLNFGWGYSVDLACENCTVQAFLYVLKNDGSFETFAGTTLTSAENKRAGPADTGWKRLHAAARDPTGAYGVIGYLLVSDTDVGQTKSWVAWDRPFLSRSPVSTNASGTQAPLFIPWAFIPPRDLLVQGPQILLGSVQTEQLRAGAATDLAHVTATNVALIHQTAVPVPRTQSYYTLAATLTFTAKVSGSVVITGVAQGSHTMASGSGFQHMLVWLDGTFDGGGNLVPLCYMGDGTVVINYAGEATMNVTAGTTYVFKLLGNSTGTSGSSASTNVIHQAALKVEAIKR